LFTHVVFFKFKDRSQENIEKAKTIMQGLQGKIPELKSMEIGLDVVHSERSYDIALITRFDNKTDMEVYANHPIHVNEVLRFLRPMQENSITVDFEG
jgi:hypothetical protein